MRTTPQSSHRAAWTLLLLIPSVALGIGSATAGDWPQILGPQRNGVAAGEVLPESWPADGPGLVWKAELGDGLAGPAVAGGKVVVFERVDDKEVVRAFDAAKGDKLWSASFDATYRGGIHADTGPRCVPTIQQGKVVVFGAAGDLHCVALADGKKLWSRAAYADYEGNEGYFGAGSSPIIVGDKVLVNVGGRAGAGIVAFDLASGETRWRATNEAASYSSPTLATLDGKTYVIFVTRLSALAIDPADGKVRFKIPFGQSGPTVNAANPILCDGRLFLTASYGIGAQLLDLAANPPKAIWENDDVMSSQYNTPIFRDGYLYGIHGREDGPAADLRCIEAKSGRVMWTEPRFGVANLMLVGDKLLIVGLKGKLVLAEANAQKFRKLAAAQVDAKFTRALPALSEGRLYLRENREPGSSLIVLKVGK